MDHRAPQLDLLQAEQVPAELQLGGEQVELAAAEADGDGQRLRRFTMNAYTGGIMRPKGFPLPVVVDLDGLRVAAGSRPILLDHDPARIVGHSEKVEVQGGVRVEGILSGGGEATQQVITAADNGFPWRASIGARAERIVRVDEGETVQANGRSFRGPLYVVRAGVLQEISFLALPGDERASATVQAESHRNLHAKGNSTMDFNAWLVACGYDPDKLEAAEKKALQAIWQRQKDQLQAGTNLAQTLERLIEQRTGDDTSRADVTARMAEAAGISRSTVNRILSAAINCPQLRRLEAFARVLNVDASTLTAAAEADGCQFDSQSGGDNNLNAAGGNGNGNGDGNGNPNGDPDPLTQARRQQAAETRRVSRIREICAGGHSELEAQAIENGWTAEQTELEVLRASRPRTPARGVDRSAGGFSPLALEAALCMSVDIPPEVAGSTVSQLEGTLHLGRRERLEARQSRLNEQEVDRAMSREYRGLTLHALMDAVIAAAGHTYTGNRKTEAYCKAAMRAERELQASTGFTSISLSGILNNVANKTLIASYEAQDVTWPRVCAVRSHSDFKVHERYRLDSTGGYKQVGPGGELEHIGLDETKFTNQLETHGAIIALTRVMMINDDLGAFQQIPQLLGRMAAIKPEEEFWKLVLSNPGSFYSTGNGNLLTGAGSALAISSLSDAVELFRNQVDSNGKPIMVDPSKLAVPTSLAVEADDLQQNTRVAVELDSSDGRQVVRNPHANRFENVVTPYLNNTSITDSDGNSLSGQSDTQWYLFADPAVRAAFAMAFLNGRRLPIIESDETEFNTLGMQWRSYHDFGVGEEDPAASVKSDGA